MKSATSLAALLAPTVLLAMPPVAAQTGLPSHFAFSVPPQGLEDALLAVARQSGREIIFSSALASGRRSPRLIGRLTVDEALRRLLAGTGLTVREEAGALVVVRDVDPVSPPDIIVTGSRIRGAQQYAPVAVLDRQVLQSQGQTDLGEAVRATIPQNFGGGQSPVIGLGAENSGSDNITSGSAINLRGLGPDATLTLLNGRRFAYDGVAEGVDVAAIPFAAVERLEIVADGASAIYGSDAVAGVANVVLRRDFSGLQTAARVGAATEGGDRQQQLEAVAGGTWAGGGVVATASYDHNSAISADQRDFSRALDPSTVLLPRISHLGAVVSGHQAVGPSIELGLDLLYSRRVSVSTFSATTTASYLQDGIRRHTIASSFVASPVIKVALGPVWSATINGSYGRDDLAYRTLFYGGGALAQSYRGSYNNESASSEASVEGPLAATAGGDVRLAAGAGYRRVALTGIAITDPSPPTVLHGSRESVYGFGEINVPLVGAGNRRAGVDRLSFNVAGRFEHYPRLGDVFTPKAGLLYAPARIIEFHGTWGRSFKAPTLYQLYQAQGAYALPAAAFGGTAYPASANAILAYGGNLNLKPQRATTWSIGGVLTPLADQRLRIESSYFHIRYTNRIVAPIPSGSTPLSDPRLADLIALNPSSATLNALFGALQTPVANYTGTDLTPATVAAIIDDRNRNVAAERYEGVDLSATWRLALRGAATVTLAASGTYLTSARQLSDGQPETPLAGHIFQPPHFRGRGGATFNAGGLTASGFVTIAGAVADNRASPAEHVAGQRSVDLSATYAFPARAGPMHGASMQLSILNAFNDLPVRIHNSYDYLTPFDATNYSPVGRFISVRLAKQW